ncbi:MAG: hypothetical protein ACJASF_000946 [Vicingaceae bacterium]|jgi:hypothetical protein
MKKTTSFLFAVFVSLSSFCQESTIAAGGDATGAGGSSSYTAGQVVYTTATGTNGSVA